MHADGRWSERVLWRKHKCSPILSTLIRSLWRPGENIVPSVAMERLACDSCTGYIMDGDSYSKMLVSEG